MIKRTLKFTLLTLLLGAGVKAFADGEITLSNGTTMSWTQFVSDLKTPPTSATGVVPENAQVRTDLADKEGIRDTAKTEMDDKKGILGQKNEALKSAKGELTAAQGVVAEKQTALKTAQAGLDAMKAELVNEAQAALDLANDSITAKQGRYDYAQNTKTSLESQKKEVEGNLITAQNTLKTLQASPNLQKMTTTTTTSTTVGWLKTVIKSALDFKNQFQDVLDEKSLPSNPVKIYYKANEAGSLTGKSLKMYISYTDPGESGWSGPVNASQFATYLMGVMGVIENEEPTFSKAYTKCNLYVYLGSNYATAIEDPDTKEITVGSTDLENICEQAYKEVNSLSSDNRFQTTTTTTTVTNEDMYPEAAAQTRQDIENTKAEITGYQTTLYGKFEDGTLGTVTNYTTTSLLGQIDAEQAKMTTLNGEITTLKQSLPGLETAVENAKNLTTETSLMLKNYYDTNVAPAETALTNAQTAETTAQGKVDAAQTEVDAAQGEYDTALATYNTAVADVKTAQDALDQAQKDANAKALTDLLAAYQDVTLNTNLNVTEATGVNYSGTIIGADNGCVITVPTGSTLFRTFGGILSNVAINGKFANVISNTAHLTNVATWNNLNSANTYQGTYYDEDGDKTEKIATLGQLGFLARELFGVDFAASKLAKLSDNTKVYNLSVSQVDVNAPALTKYVTYNDGTLTAADGVLTIPVNRFAKSATADIADCDDLVNVYYVDREGNTVSENVVITEKNNFFCPVEITANNLSYTRSFSRGYNVACLPFPMSQSYSQHIIGVCKFDNLDKAKDAFSFTSAAPDQSLAANTPILVVADEDFTFNFNYSKGITLQPTPIRKNDELIINTDPVTAGEFTNSSFGTFMSCNAGTFLGESQSEYIYGLVTKGEYKGKFRKATSGATFSPFRMVISSTWEGPTNSTPESQSVRGIRIVNSLGVDITDELMGQASGVENVTEAATSLSIVGVQGAIEFIADADYGKVEVYNVNGGLVTVADVTEGTTRVSVEKGIYIVRGKKVMVK